MSSGIGILNYLLRGEHHKRRRGGSGVGTEEDRLKSRCEEEGDVAMLDEEEGNLCLRDESLFRRNKKKRGDGQSSSGSDESLSPPQRYTTKWHERTEDEFKEESEVLEEMQITNLSDVFNGVLDAFEEAKRRHVAGDEGYDWVEEAKYMLFEGWGERITKASNCLDAGDLSVLLFVLSAGEKSRFLDPYWINRTLLTLWNNVKEKGFLGLSLTSLSLYDETINGSGYEGMAKLSDFIKSARKAMVPLVKEWEGDRMDANSLWYYPHYDGVHFGLNIYVPQLNEVRSFDSYGGTSGTSTALLWLLEKTGASNWKKPKLKSVSYGAVQNDAVSCGVFVSLYAVCVAMGVDDRTLKRFLKPENVPLTRKFLRGLFESIAAVVTRKGGRARKK